MNIEENKKLIERYPFLRPKNVWTGEVDEDYDYSYTLLDNLPDGWRKAFGAQLIEDLRVILEKGDYLHEYTIAQIKEKWGALRWYDFGIPTKVAEEYNEWEKKYVRLSEKTCIHCGLPSTHKTTGWIMPVCDACGEEYK